jgi:uncharacterized protein YlaI
MENNYMCPKCKGYLKIDKHVIFSVTTSKNEKGLLLLSPTLGDYTMLCHSSLGLKEGEKLSFYCPICHARLASKKHTNLALVLMVDPTNNVYEVMFSEIAGERCTFQVMSDSFRVFGEHSQLYREFLEVVRKGHAYKNL